MWKVSWLYEKVHDFLVVPLYCISPFTLDTEFKLMWCNSIWGDYCFNVNTCQIEQCKFEWKVVQFDAMRLTYACKQ